MTETTASPPTEPECPCYPLSDAAKAVQAAKVKAREDGITKLQASAAGKGHTMDRNFWAMVYDFEVAPMTTNRKQLAELGLEFNITNETLADLPDAACESILRMAVGGLATLKTYLVHTDHVSTKDLLRRLFIEEGFAGDKDRTSILDEPIRDHPIVDGLHEYLDLVGTGTEADSELFDKHYADPANAPPLPFPRPWLPKPAGGTPF